MNIGSSSTYQQRVERAAEAALARLGSVGPLDLFQEMGVLHPRHVDGWLKGNEHYQTLSEWIQLGPEKFGKAVRHFLAWVAQQGLRPLEAPFTRRSPGGIQTLQVTDDGDPRAEKFYRTRYAPADLSEKKTKQLVSKLEKPPELVVFEKVSEEGNCTECGVELHQGAYLVVEKQKPLCLECADLDHLVFLPSGDAALSRRARKHSVLSAVVVRFSRARKRYERQGLLVTEEALLQAEQECAADAPERAAARARAALARQDEDREFIAAFTQAVLERYPGCPLESAKRIAEHAGQRNSGRVGRSAAGRALVSKAVELAVIAHIRHAHTPYDTLLSQGVDRLDARVQVRERISQITDKWSGTPCRES